MLRHDTMKRLLAKIEEREKEIDRIHGAAERLALSCLSDAELEILAGTGKRKRRNSGSRRSARNMPHARQRMKRANSI